MLGKTAGGLFWMFRYLERAENTARLLEAGWRIALTRADGQSNEWQSVANTSGVAAAYAARHPSFEAETVIDFLLRDRDNPSSVLNSIATARSNARMVRTALSSELWEAVNDSWLALREAFARPVAERDLGETLAKVRFHTSVVRGCLHGTMLRNDIFAFSRLGTFLERADNTARILDVKYYVLLPSAAHVGTRMDNVQWEIVLRALSAASSYRWLNGGETSPTGIADFLVLDKRMPRSLAFCYSKIVDNLDWLAADYGQRHDSHARAACLAGRLEGATIRSIIDEGLHEFLTGAITDTARLAQQIETDFRFHP